MLIDDDGDHSLFTLQRDSAVWRQGIRYVELLF